MFVILLKNVSALARLYRVFTYMHVCVYVYMCVYMHVLVSLGYTLGKFIIQISYSAFREGI